VGGIKRYCAVVRLRAARSGNDPPALSANGERVADLFSQHLEGPIESPVNRRRTRARSVAGTRLGMRKLPLAIYPGTVSDSFQGWSLFIEIDIGKNCRPLKTNVRFLSTRAAQEFLRVAPTLFLDPQKTHRASRACGFGKGAQVTITLRRQ